MARHHVYDTQDEEKLCAFLDEIQHHDSREVQSVHVIPDVEGPHWFVIWKKHGHKAKSTTIGFGVGAAERRQAEVPAVLAHTGSSDTCPHAIGKPRWCRHCEESVH